MQAVLEEERERQKREAGILEAFKTLKWTRMVSLQEWEPGSARVHELGPDIVREIQ